MLDQSHTSQNTCLSSLCVSGMQRTRGTYNHAAQKQQPSNIHKTQTVPHIIAVLGAVMLHGMSASQVTQQLTHASCLEATSACCCSGNRIISVSRWGPKAHCQSGQMQVSHLCRDTPNAQMSFGMSSMSGQSPWPPAYRKNAGEEYANENSR